MTNTTQINNLYPVANATASSNPFVDVFNTRDPGPNDVQYPTQKKWLNTTNNDFWMLEGFSSAGGLITANWIRIGGGAVVETFTVDASTPPGTNPVIPNAGNITVTGGQVAAGTTANVIQTDSLAANTYTIQVQRSQAVASTTIGDNGVCHFDSAHFTVDSNGFVSASGTGVGETITGDTGGALSPTAGNWNIFGGTGCKTAGSGSTLTINVTGGGLKWVDVTGTTQTMASNTGYVSDNSMLVTLTLPAAPIFGDVIRVCGKGSGGWTIAQNSGQSIVFGTSTTMTGAGGSLSSSNQNDTLEILCTTATTTFTVLSSHGNITVV